MADAPGGRQEVSSDELRLLADKADQTSIEIAKLRDRVQAIMNGLDRRGWNAGAVDDQWARTRFGLTGLSAQLTDNHTELLKKAAEADQLNSRSPGTFMAAEITAWPNAPDEPIEQAASRVQGLVAGAQDWAAEVLGHTTGALEALGEVLPTAPDIQLDPNGPIARQARGEPINPLDWSRELAGYESQFLLAGAPNEVRNAQVTVALPGVGDQTMTAGALVALALDPANLIGMGPVEGPTAAVLEKALPYLEGPARAAVSRLLKGVAPDLAARIIDDAAVAANRTGLGERIMQRSILKASESSAAAEAVGGSIDYGGLDALGRPSGIRAVITDGMIGDEMGTAANADIIPPGYQFQKPPLARAHLLGRQLGGSGDVYENLVTLFQNPANTPLMSKVEMQVRLAVEAGQQVTYEAIPIYDGASVVPARIRIRARGIPVDGVGQGLDLDVTIENVPKPMPVVNPALTSVPADTLTVGP